VENLRQLDHLLSTMKLVIKDDQTGACVWLTNGKALALIHYDDKTSLNNEDVISEIDHGSMVVSSLQSCPKRRPSRLEI
jgi:hypothetical protein